MDGGVDGGSTLSMATTATTEMLATSGAGNDQEILSNQIAGQMSSALFVLSGIVALVGPLLPAFPVMDRVGTVLVGIAAIIVGVLVWFLPWNQWHRKRLLLLVPPALLLIGLLNHYGGADPYRYSLFFMVLFIGVGIIHPMGTCLRILPLMLIAYILPLITTE